MIGMTISHYQILEKLGEGGMGVVYKVRDMQLEREVALKVLPTDEVTDPDSRARLVREARLASKLNHPNICTIHEVGEDDGQVFVAMELVEGQSLSARLMDGALPIEEVLRLGLQLTDALAQAHKRGIIHRDLKSANVVITPEGRAKILDFGLAKRVRGEAGETTATLTQETMTTTGVIAGTPAYMSPEQFRGQAIDGRSDIWALGVMLYEMASGKRPFRGTTAYELSSAIMNEAPQPLPAGPKRAAPAWLWGVIERCLEKDPARRYQSSNEVKAILETVQAGVTLKVWLAWKYGLTRRRWLVLAAAMVAIVAVLVGLDVGGMRERLQGMLMGPKYQSLAVLPVVNLTGDPGEEYYADGMTYTLIANVSKIEGLRVIARSSVMRYKEAKVSLPEIARDLNVEAVLETSMAREGGQVHFTAQLMEAAAERSLWSETYDRPNAEVLRLQSDVAREIARQINITLTPEQANRLAGAHEVNPKVYEAYMRGKYYVSQNTPESFEKGMQYMHQAVEIDPAEPLGYVGLAEGYITLGHGGAELAESIQLARAAAEQALKLDPDRAEAVGVLAEVALYYEWDWDKAERLFKRALELDPNLAMTHYHYAWYLALFDRLDAAIAEHKIAIDYDPLRPLHTAWLGELYNHAGRYDDAIAEAKKALELNPNFNPSFLVLRFAYSHKGMHQEAIAAARRAAAITPGRGNTLLATAYALAGQRVEALAFAAKLKPNARDCLYKAVAYAAIGDKDAAFETLEAGYQARYSTVPWIRVHGNDLESLRDDPRFQDLLRRMNLPL